MWRLFMKIISLKYRVATLSGFANSDCNLKLKCLSLSDKWYGTKNGSAFSVKLASVENNILSSLPYCCFVSLHVNYELWILLLMKDTYCLSNSVLCLLWPRVHGCNMNGPRLCLWSIDNRIMVLLRGIQCGIVRGSMVWCENLNKSFGISGSQLFHWIPNV